MGVSFINPKKLDSRLRGNDGGGWNSSGARGFTLIEMMIVVAIVAILAAATVPSFSDFIEKNRVKDATEEIYGFIIQAKTESVIRDADIVLTINSGAWCMGYAATAGCDCTETDPDAAGACSLPVAGTNVLQVIDGADFPNVGITTGLTTSTFDHVRGTAGGGTITLTSGDWMLNIVSVSTNGRIKVCKPADSGGVKGVMGFADC